MADIEEKPICHSGVIVSCRRVPSGIIAVVLETSPRRVRVRGVEGTLPVLFHATIAPPPPIEGMYYCALGSVYGLEPTPFHVFSG